MAKKHLVLAINTPLPEVDQESFDLWYDGQLRKIREVPGVVTARRYRVKMGKGIDHSHFAAYEVETDDLQAFQQAMDARLHPLEPRFDRSLSLALIGELVE